METLINDSKYQCDNLDDIDNEHLLQLIEWGIEHQQKDALYKQNIDKIKNVNESTKRSKCFFKLWE